MVNRLRIFKGANELKYSAANIIRSSDSIVDQAKISIEKDNNVTSSSVIDFKKEDGTTVVFTGRINNIERDMVWDVNILGRGYELTNINILKVYENTSPEAIVTDIIDNFSENLTYASTGTSGFTISKFVAKGYLIDVIKEMMDILQWQIRIDEADNFYFEPQGTTNNGKIFTQGSNIQITKWKEDKTNMVNKVRVKGGVAQHKAIQDTATGDGTTTEYTLTEKPIGNVEVTVNSVIQTPGVDGSGDYQYNAEEKTVTFTTAPPNTHAITFDYEISIPVVVADQDDASIALHGTVFKELVIPSVDNFADAIQIASQFLTEFSLPKLAAEGFYSDLDWDRIPNEEVRIIDNVRTKTDGSNYDETLVIKKVTLDVGQNVTRFEFGVQDKFFYDWQAEVMQKIKNLENQVFNEDDLAEARIFKHILQALMHGRFQPDFNFPRDSFGVGHQTLGRFRPYRDFEPDCSDEFDAGTHHGIWLGSGIGGSQFEFTDVFTDLVSYWKFNERDGTSVRDFHRSHNGTLNGTPTWVDGKHGSTVTFDGTDDYMDAGDNTDFEFGSGDFTLEAWVRLDTLPSTDEDYTIMAKWNENGNQREFKWYVANSDDKVHFATSSDGTAETDIASTTALAVDTWYHLMVTKTGTTLNFYKDGVADGSGTVDGTLATGTAKLYIGATEEESTAPDSLMDGRIDNVRIYDNDLTVQQILELYDRSGRENFKLSSGTFNGTDRYVEVADHADLRFTGDFSIALAVKVASLPGAEDYIIHKRDATDGYAVRIASDNQVELFYSNGGSETTLKTGTALTAGVFQHVVFTKNGTALKSYVNGVAGNTGTGGATVGTTTDNLQMGRYLTNYFTGNVDDVRLYSDELSAGEAANLNNKLEHQDSMVAYWAFDDPRLRFAFTTKREMAID